MLFVYIAFFKIENVITSPIFNIIQTATPASCFHWRHIWAPICRFGSFCGIRHSNLSTVSPLLLKYVCHPFSWGHRKFLQAYLWMNAELRLKWMDVSLVATVVNGNFTECDRRLSSAALWPKSSLSVFFSNSISTFMNHMMCAQDSYMY